ncbi:MAG: YceI family protein [Candidatus Omnitrophota bacterium]
MKKKISVGAIFIVVLFACNVFAAKTYKIDPTHSTVGFEVRHLQVGITRGVFTDYSGEVQFDKEKPEDFKAEGIIQTESIDTRLKARDDHLKNADFFDVKTYPTITVKSKKLIKKGDSYEMVADLTMRGVTREVSAPVTIRGPVKSPFGTEVIGISGEVVINRHDYGISWNAKMPDGGFVVGDDVKIIVDIEAHKKYHLTEEHPKADHPTEEHPKSDHPTGEHPK